MKRSAPAVLVPLVLVACAAGGGPAPSDPPPSGGSGEPPPSAGEPGTGEAPILVVTSEGGMLPAHELDRFPPILAIGADGRVIMLGAQTLEFPGKALPPLLERRLSEEGLAEVVAAIEGTNLFSSDLDVNVEGGLAADAGVTVFTVRIGDVDATVRVGALGMLPPGQEPPPGMSAAEAEALRTMSTLNERLMTLDSWLDPSGWASDAWVPYEPSALRLYVRDVTDEPDPDLPAQELAWPVDDDPARVGTAVAAFGDGTRCWAVDGELAASWYELLVTANENTRWVTDDDRRFAVMPRPLLPHEEAACPDPAG